MDVLEYIKKMQEMYGDDVITTADKLEKPPKTVIREIFEDFNARNPKADGGQLVAPSVDGSRPGYQGKETKKSISPIAQARRETFAAKGDPGESFRKAVKDFTATSGPGTGSVFDDPAAIDIVKAELNRIKKQRNNKNLFEWSEKSDWYKKLQKRLNPNTEKGLNREFTNKLINKVVDEFFPGAYHGKDAIKNFRNDMVVKSFIQHLKSKGEFDGLEKFDPVLKQFMAPPKKKTPNNFEYIHRSWNDWRDGKFEVEGIDRAKLKEELKARNIDYDETIGKWKPGQKHLKTVTKIKQLKTLNSFNNRFTKKTPEEVRALFLKEHPGANFDLRVDELTQLKRNGVYISGSTTETPIKGIEQGDRASWLKKAYGRQFKGNYSRIINVADTLNDPNFEGGKFYNPEAAERLYNAADKFFGPKGIIRKSAVGDAEHALARSFDFLNPDRQLAINSIVSGDLNQFKKNLFDVPVKRYFDEYNNPNTTKARRVELKSLIEERKKVMNALTGGQKSGIVAGDIVNFRYGPNKITATSSVKPIDILFKQGKFNIDDYIKRGNKYTEAFQTAAKKLNLLDETGRLVRDPGFGSLEPIKADSPLYEKVTAFQKNLENKKFGRVADVVVKASKDGGFGEAVQAICRKKKAKGGRIFLSNGSGCPAAKDDPKGFLKSVSDNPQLAKFLKSSPGKKAMTLAARVSGNVLNPSTLIGGEVAFVLGDGLNNFASGLDLAESFDRAFVFADFGKFEENLINQAKKLGYDDNQLNLLQQTININKLDNRKRKLEYGLDKDKLDMSGLTSDATMGFENRLVDTNKNLNDTIVNYLGTLDKMGFDSNKAADQDTGFTYLDNVFKKRTQDQLVKDFEDRKRQVDPTQTPFGDFISPVFDLGSYTQPLKFAADIVNPFTKDVPFLSKRQQEAKKLKEMSEEELDAYNKARGFTIEDIQQGTSPQIRPLMDYLGTDVTGQGFGSMFLAGGGLANLTNTIPPKSGPMSQGLRSLYNNGRKL